MHVKLACLVQAVLEREDENTIKNWSNMYSKSGKVSEVSKKVKHGCKVEKQVALDV